MPTTTDWRTSSFSSNGSNCVEVLELTAGTWLRDSKDPHGPTLHLGPGPWRSFLTDVVDDVITDDGDGTDDGTVSIRVGADGGRLLEDATTAHALRFTAGEWRAFRRGVLAGEFGAGTTARGA